ncbi:MAG: hypothetical protein E7590_01030 [Ruminococcaceae bacterium]|nr:hypothetical protein [Oscillospiraceae bacterium]
MNELKPEDVMRALDKLKYGGHSCHDCKYAKWSGEDRCGLNGCRIAKAALALLRLREDLIKASDEELAKKDAEIERLKSIPEQLYKEMSERMIEERKIERKLAITEFADRIIRFYNALPGKTVGGSVEYHVKQVRDAMLKETEVTS